MLRPILVLILTVSLVLSVDVQAGYSESLRLAGSPHDLINAVNALRASYGLPPYAVDDILMAAAQGHAEYMAATGSMSHTGPGGSSASDRILALGYPLAGDLSLGGFKAENITSGNESMSAQEAVHRWTGDALHLNTMISPNLTEIGAGMAVNGGRVYYVIDCAQPTDSAVPQAAGAPVPAGPTKPSAVSGIIIPVVLATPNTDGDVIHEVKAGQTLWQLAIVYETKIDEIKRLNNLFDNEIYPGMRLLIKKGVVLSTSVPTGAATLAVTASPMILSASTATVPFPTVTFIPTGNPSRLSSGGTMKIVIGIIALALLGGGVVAWWGTKKKD